MGIFSLSPLDGRYYEDVKELSEYFSEWALIKYRLKVEIEWLIYLSNYKGFKEVRKLSDDEINLLRTIVEKFDEKAAIRVKEIERITKHDVKACEYYLKEILQETSMAEIMEFIHFGCTSEDINNLSYAMMLRDCIHNVWIPKCRDLVDKVRNMAFELKEISMLARTHGQPATPTTMGKELAVFVYRWERQLNQMKKIEFLGKFSGVVGNFNAQIIAYPELDWESIAEEFVNGLGLTYNPLTTQIESHDYMVECFSVIKRFNNILLDFNRDMWTYISMEYFRQKVVEGEVGSSTMPHKVNPINFEASEANVGLSNAILGHLADKLQISRLQRDLSDSSAQRNIGIGIGYSYIAVKFALIGLSKVIINDEAIKHDLQENWEVLAEAIQTVMRKTGYEKPYEKLKELTRGKKVTKETVKNFIEGLELPEHDKKRLMQLSPENYVGIAAKLVNKVGN